MPTGVYQRTKPNWNKGLKNWRPNFKFSEESKAKMSKSHTGMKKPWARPSKLAIENSIKNKPKGENHYLFGKKRPLTLEWRKKIGDSNKGEKNGRWISDRSKLKTSGNSNLDRRSSAYSNWRREVWKRDNFKCKINNSNCLGRLETHHILGWTEYPELRYDINNGITLCHAHHPRKRAEEKRLVSTFTELVSVSKV